MRLFYFEVRKMLLHQWGLIILLLYLLLQISILLGSTIDNPDSVLYQEEYFYYLRQVSGPYTEDKATLLENEAQKITKAKTDLDALYQKYYSGAITEAELQTRRKDYEDILRNENGFNVIYDQYLYICEGKGERCFLDTYGWARLLGNKMLDIPLVLAVLLLATPVFCREYACKMDALALTTFNGRKSYIWHKTILVSLTAMALCIMGAVLRCVFYAWRYGLPNGKYTIQSVELFGSSTKQLTLWDAFFILTALRLVGVLFLVVIILAVASLSHQYAMTALVPAMCVLLPWIGLPEQLQYAMPLPLPFLLGTGFLRGRDVVTDTLTGEEMTIFRELETSDIMFLLVLSAIICIVCLRIIQNRNGSAHRKRRWLGNTLILAIIVMLTLGGCSEVEMNAKEVNFNSHTSNTYETDRYCVYEENSILWVKDLETNTTTELVRDPLLNGYIGHYLFGCGDNVYYTIRQIDSYAGKLADNKGNVYKFSIIQVNLDNFEETIIYEKQQINSILGVKVNESPLEEALFSGRFFLSENALYILDGGVRRIDLRTNKVEIMDIPSASNIAFDGNHIYYVDERYALCRLNLNNGEIIQWGNISVHDFCLNGNTLYYIDMRQGGKLYAMTVDGTEQRLILAQKLLAVERKNSVALTITDKDGGVSTFVPM